MHRKLSLRPFVSNVNVGPFVAIAYIFGYMNRPNLLGVSDFRNPVIDCLMLGEISAIPLALILSQ